MTYYMEKVSLAQWNIVDEDGAVMAHMIRELDREGKSIRVFWLLTDADLHRLYSYPFPDRIVAGKFYAEKMGGKFSSSRVRPKAKNPR